MMMMMMMMMIMLYRARDHPGNLVRQGTLERGESEAPVDHQE